MLKDISSLGRYSNGKLCLCWQLPCRCLQAKVSKEQNKLEINFWFVLTNFLQTGYVRSGGGSGDSSLCHVTWLYCDYLRKLTFSSTVQWISNNSAVVGSHQADFRPFSSGGLYIFFSVYFRCLGLWSVVTFNVFVYMRKV